MGGTGFGNLDEGWNDPVSNEKTPGCLEHLLGMKNYPVIYYRWILIHLLEGSLLNNLCITFVASQPCPAVKPWKISCGGHGKFMKISGARDDLLAILNNKANTVTVHLR